jgi:hypothetical protein
MTDKEEQLERMRSAVERKAEEAEARSHEDDDTRGGPPDEDQGGASQRSRVEPGRPLDAFSVRAKNSGKGKKTADKWNQ